MTMCGSIVTKSYQVPKNNSNKLLLPDPDGAPSGNVYQVRMCAALTRV